MSSIAAANAGSARGIRSPVQEPSRTGPVKPNRVKLTHLIKEMYWITGTSVRILRFARVAALSVLCVSCSTRVVVSRLHLVLWAVPVMAEQWLNKMNGSGQDEVVEEEPEARPERLGLGAKVPRQSKVGLSNDPVARKLSTKLGAGKRKASKNQDSSTPSGQDMVNEDDGDEDLDS
ncbi:hypothetical protein F3Y22_tig00111505pilonHSYRG00023 [Hibiscus syriacus]|uniref:Uncharacterized protein n=1 Tax=Hibiscus syriacus TaxID=106335 RepID=A0A6A2XP78_HIBSY|nr:hypothetical protein F3Y22_tig00111505pilonHSYRG00023 [Hibiscus syriacus]